MYKKPESKTHVDPLPQVNKKLQEPLVKHFHQHEHHHEQHAPVTYNHMRHHQRGPSVQDSCVQNVPATKDESAIARYAHPTGKTSKSKRPDKEDMNPEGELKVLRFCRVMGRSTQHTQDDRDLAREIEKTELDSSPRGHSKGYLHSCLESQASAATRMHRKTPCRRHQHG